MTEEQKDTRLKQLYTLITSVMKDDVDHKKYRYESQELPITLSSASVNEHIAFNRLKKIEFLYEIMQGNTWQDFKEKYKDDVVLKNIGVEFLVNKFHFDKEVLEDINAYPKRKSPLYYFQKGVDLNIDKFKDLNYEEIKEIVLCDVAAIALEHQEQKADLKHALNKINISKSQKQNDNLYLFNNPDKSKYLLDEKWSNIIPQMSRLAQSGQFKYKQIDSFLFVEFPMSGSVWDDEQGKRLKKDTAVLRVDTTGYNTKRDEYYTIIPGILDEVISQHQKEVALSNANLMRQEGQNNKPKLRLVVNNK